MESVIEWVLLCFLNGVKNRTRADAYLELMLHACTIYFLSGCHLISMVSSCVSRREKLVLDWSLLR